ncbi:MAG: hypothetical protein HY721_00775 [Planctomycetes bacterium]|nr:hypothetical protein [Planctomycetota bacterium]
MRARRDACRALAAILALALGGCAQIALRSAMDRVQRRAKHLSDELERGDNFRVREAALDLRAAFEARAVKVDSPHAPDPEYQRLLAEAVRLTDEVEAAARKFDKRALGDLRSRISARCDACHEVFRRERG